MEHITILLAFTCCLKRVTHLGIIAPVMRNFPLLSAIAMEIAGLRTARVACLLVAMLLLTQCAHKKDEDEKRSPYSIDSSRAPRDPVEDRIFYQGWRHPN